MDHLMRELPSQKYTQIKKSFFARGSTRFNLGGGVEAFKGVFASMRMVHSGLTTGPCLSVNVDVANGTFFTEMDLIDMMRELCRVRTNEDLCSNFQRAVQGDWHRSPMYRALKALTHVSVNLKNIRPTQGKPWATFKIHRFLNKDPYNYTFTLKQRDESGNVTSSQRISIAEHFRNKWNINCAHNLPVVELTKKDNFVPVEALHIPQNQRFKVKLDDKQTSQVCLLFSIHSDVSSSANN
jgi:eukaryotic translation initiation factor 2C